MLSISRDILERWARVLVEYSLAVSEGQLVVIQGTVLAAPLIREVYRQVLRAGAHPQVDVELDGLAEIFYREAPEAALDYVSPVRRLIAERADARLSILAEYNTRHLSGVDARRLSRRSQALSELNRLMMDRAARQELRWCVTLYPTHAHALEASMSLEDYEAFVVGACHLDEPDPVATWRRVHDVQARVIERLNRVRELRFVRPPDTDLRVGVEDRHWENADGLYNFPDGEVFTGPLEASVEGRIRFSFPGIYMGKAIEDISLTFHHGEVTAATAARGQDLLEALLATDPGARRVGEVAFGTNWGIDRFTREMLFDEKMGGTVHLALGAGYPETGSQNRSAIHWDMLCDMRQGGEVYADGELIYREGRFTGLPPA